MVMRPSLLNESYTEFCATRKLRANVAMSRQAIFRQLGCSCNLIRLRSFTKIGPINISTQYQQPHEPACLFYSWQERLWHSKARVSLLPFFLKSLEITFTARYGAGGHAISPHLAVYNTVKRLESPAFQLFDHLHSSCCKHLSPWCNRSFRQDTTCRYLGECLWDLAAVEEYLPTIIPRLYEYMCNGQASVKDKDEYGNTLLHVRIYRMG
jgi:hypothetical protein